MAAANYPSPEYYDIVLIGRTGRGKSTLGNKLLQVKSHDEGTILKIVHVPKKKKSTEADQMPTIDPSMTEMKELDTEEKMERFTNFPTTDDLFNNDDDFNNAAMSVTSKLEIAVNTKTNVRVIDTPGFADSNALKFGNTVYQENLRLFRSIVYQQNLLKSKLQVNRMLYFLPDRGYLEKADAVLQEELKVMYHYFGDAIFNCMVIIGTNQELSQQVVWTDEHYSRTKRVFVKALEMVTENSFKLCPPIVYVGINDGEEDVLKKIKSAKVLVEQPFEPEFQSDVCARCSLKIYYTPTSSKPVTVEMKENKVMKPYSESSCHPYFITRSTMAQKVFGTVIHATTLGIPYGYGKLSGYETWAGYSSLDEICVKCHCFPGAEGCCKVLTTVMIDNEAVTVKHSNKL